MLGGVLLWSRPGAIRHSSIWNVRLGADQGLACDDDDAFVVGTRGVGGKVGVQRICGFSADDREVPIGQLKNVRTIASSCAPPMAGGYADPTDDLTHCCLPLIHG